MSGHPPLARVIFMYQHCPVTLYWTAHGTFSKTSSYSLPPEQFTAHALALHCVDVDNVSFELPQGEQGV